MAWQVASLSSLIVSYVIALRGSGFLAPYVGTEEPWNRFLAMFHYLPSRFGRDFGSCFNSSRGLSNGSNCKNFDRQVGAVIGFLPRGAAICLAITFFTVTLSTDARDTILHTRSGYVAAIVMDRAHLVMPDEVHDVLGPYVHQLDDAVPDEHLHHAGHSHPGHGHEHGHDHEHGDGHRHGDGRDLTDHLKERAGEWIHDSFKKSTSPKEPADRVGETDENDPLDRLFRR